MTNTFKSLSFSGPHIEAALVENADRYLVEGRTIVANPGVSDVRVCTTPGTTIPPFSSTILSDTHIDRADSLILMRVNDEKTMPEIVEEPGWRLLGDLLDAGPAADPFPRETPLWKSPQDNAGTVVFEPSAVLKEARRSKFQEFQIVLNLWFAPAGTDCFIHNRHDFIEVHTQVHGFGRMQKFREPDYGTLYQDVWMGPGYTTPDPFCGTASDGAFVYPWHQYRAESDCVWLAIEYHR
jgi:hypothetical protein